MSEYDSESDSESNTESFDIDTEEIHIEYNYENLDNLWSIKNTISYASCVYLIINIICTTYNIWYAIPVFLLMFGIFGITRYNNYLSTYFLLYLILKLIFDFYALINLNNEIDTYLLTILIILKVYLLELTIRFLIKICNLNENELKIIKDNYTPNNRRMILY